MQLREFLFHKRIKQRAFAAALHITPTYLHMLVKGSRTPGANLAYRIEQLTEGAVALRDWQEKAIDKPE